MALQLWETLKESITAYTGFSPATFFTVLAVGLTLYYFVSNLFGSSDDRHIQQRSRGFEEQMEPLPPPVQLGEITADELKQYDGSDPKKPLLMAIKGQIYDVTQSRMFYGPGGPYALFAGKDASRALAKMSFEDKDLNGDLTGLGIFELEALQDWEYKFMSKYVKVGTIKTTVPINEGTSEWQPPEAAEGTGLKPADGEDTKPTDCEASKPADGEASKPADGEDTQPTDFEASKPADGEDTKPTDCEASKPADGEALKPADGEVHGPAEDVQSKSVIKESEESVEKKE